MCKQYNVQVNMKFQFVFTSLKKYTYSGDGLKFSINPLLTSVNFHFYQKIKCLKSLKDTITKKAYRTACV